MTSTQSTSSSFRRRLGRMYRGLLSGLPRNRIGDRAAALIQFARHHRRLPSAEPLYNDVLYRIKTSDDILDPLRVFVTDKELVKLYIRAMVGDAYNVPTLGVIRSPEAVEAFDFPPDCCIKPTHCSGRVILRRDNAPVDRNEIRSWFSLNHYSIQREANYKLLRPKVIVEPLIFGGVNVEDYKFFCVNGAPRIIQVDVDRHIEHKRKYFDADWNELDFSIKYPRTDRAIPRPQNLPEMLEVVAKLSEAFWFTRVDLYSNGVQLYAGEITHVPDNANGGFIPPSAEKRVSEYVFGKARTATARLPDAHAVQRAQSC